MNPEEVRVIEGRRVEFRRDADDRLVMQEGDHQTVIGTMTMSFPLSLQGRLIVIRDEEGNELGILDDARRLSADSRRLVREETEKAYFMPRILEVHELSEELGVVTMRVLTDRGERTFQIRRVHQNIRKLGRVRLMIRDVDGNRYEITDWTRLPPATAAQLQEYL